MFLSLSILVLLRKGWVSALRTFVFISFLIVCFILFVSSGAMAQGYYYNYPGTYYNPSYYTSGSYYNNPYYTSSSYYYDPYYTMGSYYNPYYTSGSYYNPYYGYNYAPAYGGYGYGYPGYGYGGGYGYGCGYEYYNDYAMLGMIVSTRLQIMQMLYGSLHVSGALGNSAAILGQAF